MEDITKQSEDSVNGGNAGNGYSPGGANGNRGSAPGATVDFSSNAVGFGGFGERSTTQSGSGDVGFGAGGIGAYSSPGPPGGPGYIILYEN